VGGDVPADEDDEYHVAWALQDEESALGACNTTGATPNFAPRRVADPPLTRCTTSRAGRTPPQAPHVRSVVPATTGKFRFDIKRSLHKMQRRSASVSAFTFSLVSFIRAFSVSVVTLRPRFGRFDSSSRRVDFGRALQECGEGTVEGGSVRMATPTDGFSGWTRRPRRSQCGVAALADRIQLHEVRAPLS